MHRTRALVALVAVALVVAACGSDPTAPPAATGVFRLVSVDGQPLPYVEPPSSIFPGVITRGDLLLREDGTFAMGIRGSFGGFDRGSFRTAGESLTLTSSAVAGTTTTGSITPDSVVLDFVARRYVFRREALPSLPVALGTFVLTSVNGSSAPLTLFEGIVGGARTAHRVRFDSLTILDPVFYRRRRAEFTVRYLASGDSVVGETEWSGYGPVGATAQNVVLHLPYVVQGATQQPDTLVVTGPALVRLSTFMSATIEERYERRP